MKQKLTPTEKIIKLKKENDEFLNRMLESQKKYSGQDLVEFNEYWTGIYNRKQNEIIKIMNKIK